MAYERSSDGLFVWGGLEWARNGTWVSEVAGDVSKAYYGIERLAVQRPFP